KKAKSGKSSTQPMPEPSSPVVAVTGAVRDSEATVPTMTAVPPTDPVKFSPSVVATPSGSAALDALFSWSAETAIGDEEGYRQGLLGREEEEEELRQWLTFTLGREEYALEITSIREIIKLREITDIPRVPEFLLGIISLRGMIIPVFDLKNRLKLGRSEFGPDSRIIVCQADDRAAGLLVDAIAQVISLPEQAIEPPPAVLSGLDRDLVAGVGRHQGRMMVLLQLHNVLNAELY
ncbi:purine-binding chemotaxis protein CheW, partial [bacterium]|nr:purine-binding chemotaxis protein CheW [bacterium]